MIYLEQGREEVSVAISKPPNEIQRWQAQVAA